MTIFAGPAAERRARDYFGALKSGRLPTYFLSESIGQFVRKLVGVLPHHCAAGQRGRAPAHPQGPRGNGYSENRASDGSAARRVAPKSAKAERYR